MLKEMTWNNCLRKLRVLSKSPLWFAITGRSRRDISWDPNSLDIFFDITMPQKWKDRFLHFLRHVVIKWLNIPSPLVGDLCRRSSPGSGKCTSDHRSMVQEWDGRLFLWQSLDQWDLFRRESRCFFMCFFYLYRIVGATWCGCLPV